MVSRLVDEDTGNRTSEEGIVSGSKGPDVSESCADGDSDIETNYSTDGSQSRSPVSS